MNRSLTITQKPSPRCLIRAQTKAIRILSLSAIALCLEGTIPAKAQPDAPFQVLHSFGFPGDGRHPYAGLITDSSGALYGTTADGGSDYDTVFKLTRDGAGGYTHSVLKSFNGSDGSHPYAGLIADSAGALYGTTSYGGSSGVGTVFKLTPDGAGGYTHSVLKSLNGSDGAHPYAALHLGANSKLYGTTVYGGDFGHGTVFSIEPDDDNDGISDDEDICPQSPPVGDTIVINGCITGVPNLLLSGGCTIADQLAAVAAAAQNHDQFVSGVAELKNVLRKQGILTKQQATALQTCAAQAQIP